MRATLNILFLIALIVFGMPADASAQAIPPGARRAIEEVEQQVRTGQITWEQVADACRQVKQSGWAVTMLPGNFCMKAAKKISKLFNVPAPVDAQCYVFLETYRSQYFPLLRQAYGKHCE